MESEDDNIVAEGVNGDLSPITVASALEGDNLVLGTDDHVLVRKGTINSARFNMLCTLVGGGCLSLPMAFQKTGSALTAPIFLLGIAGITHYCFHIMIATIRKLSPRTYHNSSTMLIGNDSFEGLTSAAFGPFGFVLSKVVVMGVCYFGALGYCILLRDMLKPVTHSIFTGLDEQSPWFQKNCVMLTVVLIMTPVCTLETLSPLKNLGALSMSSIALFVGCLVYRSLECNMGYYDGITSGEPWGDLKLFPNSARDVLDALPVYIYCYGCHYNIPLVHNELTNPTKERVAWWLTSTMVPGTLFYVIIGVAGSSYAHCTSTGVIAGNVLLNFDENDPLLLVARLCLSVTIAMAWPMQIIPARDILLRSVCGKSMGVVAPVGDVESLSAPLLPQDEVVAQQYSFGLRFWFAVTLFWTAAGIASGVDSIAIVWDILGSTFSTLMSYLIPCGSYIMIVCDGNHRPMRETDWLRRLSLLLAWILVIVFTPLMVISTVNAVINECSSHATPVHVTPNISN